MKIGVLILACMGPIQGLFTGIEEGSPELPAVVAIASRLNTAPPHDNNHKGKNKILSDDVLAALGDSFTKKSLSRQTKNIDCANLNYRGSDGFELLFEGQWKANTRPAQLAIDQAKLFSKLPELKQTREQAVLEARLMAEDLLGEVVLSVGRHKRAYSFPDSSDTLVYVAEPHRINHFYQTVTVNGRLPDLVVDIDSRAGRDLRDVYEGILVESDK